MGSSQRETQGKAGEECLVGGWQETGRQREHEVLPRLSASPQGQTAVLSQALGERPLCFCFASVPGLLLTPTQSWPYPQAQ